jgi:hypothetical protein
MRVEQANIPGQPVSDQKFFERMELSKTGFVSKSWPDGRNAFRQQTGRIKNKGRLTWTQFDIV